MVCYTVVSGEHSGQVIRFVWTRPDGQKEVESSTVLGAPMPGHPQFASSTLVRRKALPKGNWSVDIYVDGVLSKSVSFTLS
jgi:hypothetical protein